MLLFGLVGLSVSVLTGWAGQLSLGQFAFVGVGAMVCGALHGRGMGFVAATGFATLAGIAVAVLIGFPALRVRGLFLAITTLAFAVAARSWILVQPALIGDGTVRYLPRGEGLGIDFHSQRAYYYAVLVVVVLAAAGVSRLRASGVGRSIIAMRENEAAAASFTLSPRLAKLLSFGLAGGLAALAGALLAGLRVQYGADLFGPEQSLQIVSMTIIGGLGSVFGPMLGALYVVGLPALFGHSDAVGLATSGIGLLVLLLYLPGGLMQVVYRARDALLERVARAAPPAVAPQARVLPARPARAPLPAADALVASGITVRFGGRIALDEVAIRAGQGEVVGLIGSNGAGKSTLLNVVSGFVTPARGMVAVGGIDVSALPPHLRARHGIGRVFQDARLFGDLTVTETVKVALEARERSELLPSLLTLPPSRRAERVKAAEADAHIDLLGLGRYADRFLSELSTGTRRIVELCCLLAQDARLLLLDEPTAGVAQRETEAFGPLIRRVQQELGATIVVIEHDIPLVLSISDRVYCLAAGAVIAEGLPAAVRHDPAVVAAYLGTDERAIVRSDVAGA
jgi:ABC-type branched-subunit amino acid transport system ATPase component/ABC-type branched-subunit amino acid transport system permease subunit